MERACGSLSHRHPAAAARRKVAEYRAAWVAGQLSQGRFSSRPFLIHSCGKHNSVESGCGKGCGGKWGNWVGSSIEFPRTSAAPSASAMVAVTGWNRGRVAPLAEMLVGSAADVTGSFQRWKGSEHCEEELCCCGCFCSPTSPHKEAQPRDSRFGLAAMVGDAGGDAAEPRPDGLDGELVLQSQQPRGAVGKGAVGA